jgi:hypothetical protein
MATYNHIVLTRFNMREDINNPKIPSVKWHEERFLLFEKYCYFSMKSQTNLNFKWLVFFDELTPKKFLPKINHYKALSNFTPIFSNNLSHFRDHLADYLDDNIDYLITSRLDNDDAVGYDFINCVQKQFNNQNCEFINFYDGYILHKNKLYKHKDNSNAFLSLIEKSSGNTYKTVWCIMHHKASEIARLAQIKNNPLWLQVVHSKNISNRVKGIRIRNIEIENKFKITFEKTDNIFNYYLDLLCFTQVRMIREILFKLLKKLLIVLHN